MLRGAPKRILAMLAALTAALGLAACGGLGWAGGSGNAVRVLMVNNPQMVDLQKLSGTFTQQTGIKVDFTVLPENDLRDKASLEFASQAGQYDVAHVVRTSRFRFIRRTTGSPRWMTTSPRTPLLTRPTYSSPLP